MMSLQEQLCTWIHHSVFTHSSTCTAQQQKFILLELSQHLTTDRYQPFQNQVSIIIMLPCFIFFKFKQVESLLNIVFLILIIGSKSNTVSRRGGELQRSKSFHMSSTSQYPVMSRNAPQSISATTCSIPKVISK